MEIGEVKETREELSHLDAEFASASAEVPIVSGLPNAAKDSRSNSAAVLVGIFLLGAIAFLYFAKVFFLPVVLAMMLSFLLKPIVKWMARFKVPPALGAALVLIMVLLALGNGITQLTKPATDFIARLPESLRQVENKMRHFLRPAEQLTQAAAQVGDMTNGHSEQRPATEVKVKRASLGDTVFSATTSFLTGAIETLVLLYFLLSYGDVLLQKLVKVLPNFQEKKKATTIAHEVQQNISSFLFTVTVINLALGLLVGLGVWWVGLGNAILWGVTAALLNFIPYFGPIVGVSTLALAGLLTFDSVGRGFIPPVIYLTLHVLESNFITPMILGRRLTLNPVVIFISLMFWTWLWGVPGALLSVPLLMVLKILCDHSKTLTPLGEFLSG